MSFILVGVAVVGAAITIGSGIAKTVKANKAKREAKTERDEAKIEMKKYRQQYENLDTSNIYADVKNKYANIQTEFENVYEDMTVNQQQAQFEKQMQQQQQANIMQGLKGAAGGSGIAALAQSMAQQGQIGAQRISADIGKQEQAIQMAKAKGAADVQQMERQAELQIAGGEQQAEAQRLGGAETARGLQWQRTGTLLGMSQQRVAGSKQAVAAAQQQEQEGLSTVASGGGQMAQASDRRLKKNINLVDKSPEGINIYNFEYITNEFGEGVYQGVMSDEIPQEAVLHHSSGYDMVNYSMLDVEFKRIN